MLKLKEVVDKQRDEIRAKTQEISSVSKEVEAVRTYLPSPIHQTTGDIYCHSVCSRGQLALPLSLCSLLSKQRECWSSFVTGAL